MNSDKDRNQILLITPVIVPYYLFLVMELRNVLFINFICHFTEFKFVNSKILYRKPYVISLVNLNSCK